MCASRTLDSVGDVLRKTIHKFEVPIGAVEIPVPADARLLSCGVQGNAPVIWVELSHDMDKRVPTPKTLLVAMTRTGGPVPLGHEFLGTVQLVDSDGSEFVGHIYFSWS